MFFHNFKYRIKCIIFDKQMMFWTLLFPILLATLFNMAFSNLSSSEKFSKINIAVVNNEEINKNKDFIKAIESVSSSTQSGNKEDLFVVKYTTKEEADTLLNDSKISGYIYFNKDIILVVKESGIEQSIIKSFIDDFKQTSSTIATIISKNTEEFQNGNIHLESERKEYLREISKGKNEPDTTVNYFYSLIAMACLYGGFWGLKEVVAIQANLSPEAARLNMAPTHKLKVFFVAIIAATLVQLIEIFILLFYLIFVLKINFGNQIGYILLSCLVGTITGVTFGACVASIIKSGEGLKTAIIIGFTMVMSFLSGMMYDKMKYIIRINAPILGYLNPANLITDLFYSLYYYNDHVQYFKDISILCFFILAFSIITYLVLRRQKYASL